MHDAIRNGMLGQIIVTYFEWSGVEHQNVIVPWTIIDGAEAALLRCREPGTDADLTDDTGRRVETGHHVYRGDSYSFEMTLVQR